MSEAQVVFTEKPIVGQRAALIINGQRMTSSPIDTVDSDPGVHTDQQGRPGIRSPDEPALRAALRQFCVQRDLCLLVRRSCCDKKQAKPLRTCGPAHCAGPMMTKDG